MSRKELLRQINKWHKKGEHEKIAEVIEALPREEWDYELTCLLARAYNNTPGDKGLEKAVSLLESVSGDGKDDPLWHYRMGYTLFYLFRKSEALACFRRTAELDPDAPNVQYFIQQCENAVLPIVKTDSQMEENIPESTKKLLEKIAPFCWVNHAGSASVCLNVGKYLQDVFDS